MEAKFIKRIVKTIESDRKRYPSDARHAQSLGVSTTLYSRLKSGEIQAISEEKLMSIGRELDVNLKDDFTLKIVATPIYTYICEQLKICQSENISNLLCDFTDIGKSIAAKDYAAKNKNAFYIDCSQVKSKQLLIRRIARKLGLSPTGRYVDVYENVCYYLRTLENPIVILDEGGDLQYEAFLETKALWNATDGSCAWFTIGANALKAKFEHNIAIEKVGYAENFSRNGSNYGRVTPVDAEEREKMINASIAMIVKANAPAGTDVNRIVHASDGHMRRMRTEIKKLYIK